jgi:hypothetical protein
MSALGHKRTLRLVHSMSASPPKADIGWMCCEVRFVPIADMLVSSAFKAAKSNQSIADISSGVWG